MNKLKYILLSLSLISGFIVVLPAYASATGVVDDACTGTGSASAICKDNNDPEAKVKNFILTLVNALLYILGAVSVIVIIVAGIFYATSGGDQNLVTKAKDTLRYAVIGVIVAVSSYAIVNFVISRLFPTN